MPPASSPDLAARCRNAFRCQLGAIILGMNDALVEMTGALAGFTMALGSNRLIALAGLTTGVAATLSMAAAEFLSQEATTTTTRSRNAALCTGLAYIITVSILLIPFFIFAAPLPALGVCLLLAALIIFCFTWITARINRACFLPAFTRMLTISFTVAAIAFIISWLARIWWGIEV